MTNKVAQKNSPFLFLFLGLTLFLTSREAKAYLDPGTGTIIIQGLVAAVVGGAVAIKMYWFKVRTFFGKKNNTENDNNQQTLEK